MAVATRISGDPDTNKNGLFFIYSDHLGSNSFLSDDTGALITGSLARYLPFGGYRQQPGTNPDITDMGFTGHRHNDDIGLIYMNARYYLPGAARFISADTIVPNPADPQSFNRYSYALNNPVKYTDPSGHCVFIPPFDTAVCIAVLALALTGDSEQPPLPEPNYPENLTYVNEDDPCHAPLVGCFEPVVNLMDFEGRGEDNPIPSGEFEELLDAVAEDLYNHDLTSPGYLAGRGEYDTPFYNGGGSRRRTDNPEGFWPANQQVCIEDVRCSGRSEINYFAQGMWSAAAGESPFTAEVIAYGWKLGEYAQGPSEDALFWLEYGYTYYQGWLETQSAD